jgi:hypothetical protein
MSMILPNRPMLPVLPLVERFQRHAANCAAYRMLYLREKPTLPPLRLWHRLGLAPIPGVRRRSSGGQPAQYRGGLYP